MSHMCQACRGGRGDAVRGGQKKNAELNTPRVLAPYGDVGLQPLPLLLFSSPMTDIQPVRAAWQSVCRQKQKNP